MTGKDFNTYNWVPTEPDGTGTWPPDPVHQFNGEWWFWDESYMCRFGPYSTKEEAQEGVFLYCKYLDKLGWREDNINAHKVGYDWSRVLIGIVIAIILLLGIILMGHGIAYFIKYYFFHQ